MIFLVILFFFLIYLAISVGAVIAATRWAKKRNRRPWIWGGLAAFVMYNLVFWDWIPTLVAHKYYCATEAGFWVYKTPEEWKRENPAVAETLDERRKPRSEGLPGGWHRYWLNQRFYVDVRQEPDFSHAIGRESHILRDASSGQVLARVDDVWRGKSGNVFAIGGSLDDLRQALVLGWGNRHCGASGSSPIERFNQVRHEYYRMGEHK